MDFIGLEMSGIDLTELLKVLPALIKENDTVKGAILTALSGVVATRDDIRDLVYRMDKGFDEIDKRFDEIDKRFDEIDERFEEQKAFNAKILERIDGLSAGNVRKFELFCINWIKKQENLAYIDLRRNFPDLEHKVHKDQKFFEVDFFLEDPLIVGEATLTYNKQGKVEKFVAKCKELETRFGRPAIKYFFAMDAQSEELKQELLSVCNREKIYLVLGAPSND